MPAATTSAPMEDVDYGPMASLAGFARLLAQRRLRAQRHEVRRIWVAPAAVIFDCDGTLVDTEPLAWDAWRHVLAPHGIAVTDDDVAACTGTSFEHTYRHFADRAHLPPPDQIRRLHDARLLARIETEAKAFPDALALCRRLHRRGVPTAVASSSPRHRLDLTLRVAGLDPYFDVVVSRDDVERGKPDPDLFLAAAHRLDVDPGQCIVVEDAAPGLEAARRAGMTTVAVRRAHNAGQRDLDADIVADHLRLPMTTRGRQ